MATKQEGAASLLADKNDPSVVKDSPKVAVKPVESEEAGKRAQKRKESSYPSDVTCSSNKDETTRTGTVEDNDTKPPAAKKRRVDEVARSPLLECSSEIMRNVYSFLPLKDALEVRRTCHELHDGNVDVFQYSNLRDLQGKSYTVQVTSYRERLVVERLSVHFVLCNLGSADKLRAVLRNKTLDEDWHRDYLWELVEKSKRDDAEAVSILLEHDHVQVDVEMLETALKRDFTEMAEVLKQVDSIKKDIKMCASCSVNIGYYDCGEACTNSNGSSSKFCRSCMLAVNKACVNCKQYLCPSCVSAENYHACEKCNDVCCHRGRCASRFDFLVCQGREGQVCNRKKCDSCIQADKEDWYYDIAGTKLCPDCHSDTEDDNDSCAVT